MLFLVLLEISRNILNDNIYYSLIFDCFVVIGRMFVVFRVWVNNNFYIVLGSEDSSLSGIYYVIVFGYLSNIVFLFKFVRGLFFCDSYIGLVLR